MGLYSVLKSYKIVESFFFDGLSVLDVEAKNISRIGMIWDLQLSDSTFC